MPVRYFYGNNNSNGNGISERTGIIIGCVVGIIVLFSLISCCMIMRRRSSRNKAYIPPSLPQHMLSNNTNLPPPPPAYIRPTTSGDLPPYRPPAPNVNDTGTHPAWATTTPATIPYSAAAATQINRSASYTSPPSSPPIGRRNGYTIFRRPVPPLHTSADLSPDCTAGQGEPLQQVTPYNSRRGERLFGERGLDAGHPDQEGETRRERESESKADRGEPPTYDQIAARTG